MSAIVLIILILGGIVWFFMSQSHPMLPSSTGTSTEQVGSTPTKPNIADVRASATKYSDHGQYYDIDLQYPSKTALAGTASAVGDANAVSSMKAFSENTAESFKEDGNFANLTPEDIQIQGLDQDRKYTLSDTYQFYSSPSTISYAFSIYSDTLGAHPNGFFRTFTFDAKTAKSLALSDLFKPGSDYLSAISSLSRTMLTKQLGEFADADMIKPGTTADEDNFQNFVLDGQTLTILFPPYQVAAYAAGPQTVKIPLSQLSDILNPAYK